MAGSAVRKPGGKFPVPRALRPNLAIRPRPLADRRPPEAPRLHSRGCGQTGIRNFRRSPRGGTRRQASPRRPEAAHRAGASPRPHPVRDAAALEGPKTPKCRSEASEEPRSGRLHGVPEGNPDGPDRSAAPAQGESGDPRRKNRRRAGLPNPPNRQRTTGRDRTPVTAAGPRSPRRDRRPPERRLPWAIRSGPKPEGSTTVADDPALSRGK